MKIGTTYYRLLDAALERLAAVYRIRYSRTALLVERYDPETSAWTEAPASFLRFVNDGEIGADEISPAEADAMIAAGLPALLPEAATIAG